MLEDKNHNLDLKFPDDIDVYLEEETQFEAIMGPFWYCPIPDCHISPFLTREKVNAMHRRVVIDLARLKDASVGLGVDKNSYLNTVFSLSFATVDRIMDVMVTHRYKVDISCAFHHVKIDPHDFGFEIRHATQIFHDAQEWL